jgi:DNA polymerase/3'-5' exonuclease PolX
VALELSRQLAPYCDRLEIAGSIRRRRPFVSDIELVFVSKMGTRKLDLLAEEIYPKTEDAIAAWQTEGVLAQRQNSLGRYTWGEWNKLAVHVKTGIPVDLFRTTPENWWMALVIRTGGKVSNIMLAKAALQKGWKLEACGRGFASLRDEGHHDCTSERDVFEFAGMRYLPPEARL